MEFSLFNVISFGIALLGIVIAVYFGCKESKMSHAIKRIGQLSSQSKSICSSLDSFEEALINGRIGANSAEIVIKTIKPNMAALNGEIEDIYKEYIKKKK
jgi:hypothetical protein